MRGRSVLDIGSRVKSSLLGLELELQHRALGLEVPEIHGVWRSLQDERAEDRELRVDARVKRLARCAGIERTKYCGLERIKRGELLRQDPGHLGRTRLQRVDTGTQARELLVHERSQERELIVHAHRAAVVAPDLALAVMAPGDRALRVGPPWPR